MDRAIGSQCCPVRILEQICPKPKVLTSWTRVTQPYAREPLKPDEGLWPP